MLLLLLRAVVFPPGAAEQENIPPATRAAALTPEMTLGPVSSPFRPALGHPFRPVNRNTVTYLTQHGQRSVKQQQSAAGKAVRPEAAYLQPFWQQVHRTCHLGLQFDPHVNIRLQGDEMLLCIADGEPLNS